MNLEVLTITYLFHIVMSVGRNRELEILSEICVALEINVGQKS
jgi:hypothetical protein